MLKTDNQYIKVIKKNKNTPKTVIIDNIRN